MSAEPTLPGPVELLARLNGEEPAAFAGPEPMHPHGPVIIRSDALMRKVFPPPRWAVDGVVPEGLTFLVGPPKIGKSWLILNIAAAVALGGAAIGKVPVAAGDVLYIAAEDTERRLQERLATTLDGEPPPDRLHLATAWPTLDEGAALHLREWLRDHPDTRLVVVDTLARLRGPVPGAQNLYAADYAAAGALKAIADESGIALVVVHHTRKAFADDPLDMVSGTTGLAGAADSVAVLRREIGRHDATLYIRGRDVPEADHALTFDVETCQWTLAGDAAAFRMSEERRAIVEVLAASPEPMAPKDIADALGKAGGSVRYLLHKMVSSGEVAGIGKAYRLPPNSPNALTVVPGTAPGALAVPTSTPNARTGETPGMMGIVSGVRAVSGTPGDDRWTA